MDDEIGISENDGGESGSGNGMNPAWNDLLSKVPEDIHEQITPILRDWDSGVQKRFEDVHAGWNDFKFLKENDVSAEDTRIALGILRAVQEDPRSVYDSIGESFGYTTKEPEMNPENPVQGESESDFTLPPHIQAKLDKFDTLEAGYNQLAEIALANKQKEEHEKQDKELKKELDSLRAQHGDFNEKFVLNNLLEGMSPEDAIKEWNSVVEQIKNQNARVPAPRLLGSSGGGIPGEQRIDPTKLSGAETKNLVAKYLEAHANQ